MTINISKQDLVGYYIIMKLTLGQIGEIYNCSGTTIQRKMVKFNIPRRSLSEANQDINKGKNNGMWKGDNVGYRALHEYIRKYKPEPERCKICGKKTDKLELSNKDHRYTRNIEDYWYLCRKCHLRYDDERS